MNTGHSVVAPSSLHRIRQCPASIRMQEPFPEDPTSEASLAAAEGTAAHWAMAEQMDGRLVSIGDQAPNGIFLTAEMVEAADLIVADVRLVASPDSCMTEVPVDISRIHPLCWGTPDIRVWVPPMVHQRHTIYVWDLKFGYRHVPVFENEQIVAYAFGGIDAAGLDPSTVDVVARIVQPRNYHQDGAVREWRFRASDALPLVAELQASVTEALGPNPRTRVGPACRDCRARAADACETYRNAAADAMDVAGTAMPHQLPPSALGIEYRYVTRMLEFLEGRKEALEQQIMSAIRGGARVPHCSLETGTGRNVWAVPDAQVILAGQLHGINVSKPPEAITPKQAIAKGFPDSLAGSFVKRGPSAAKVKIDDGSEARRIFGYLHDR